MKQSDVVLESAGDLWLERNRAKLGKRDPVTEMIVKYGYKPSRILEIGCANGWRLEKLRKKFGCEVLGVEPSATAVAEAAAKGIKVVRGTAESLPFNNHMFDLVICGFFLYFADPADHLRIVAEVDRVLAGKSLLVIYDFMSPRPWCTSYAFDQRIKSYHFDWAQLWMAHPSYRVLAEVFDGGEHIGVSLLIKNVEEAFPYVAIKWVDP